MQENFTQSAKVVVGGSPFTKLYHHVFAVKSCNYSLEEVKRPHSVTQMRVRCHFNSVGLPTTLTAAPWVDPGAGIIRFLIGLLAQADMLAR